jgi:hypothetical protein
MIRLRIEDPFSLIQDPYATELPLHRESLKANAAQATLILIGTLYTFASSLGKRKLYFVPFVTLFISAKPGSSSKPLT